jgi:ketosteroid isomerase-like protein
MNDLNPTLEQRLQRAEDRQAIQELAVLYGYIMDERDEEGIRAIFTDDATLSSADGVFAAEGIDSIVETYLGRFKALGPTNHFSHGHVVRFDDSDPDVARGLLASHAEVDRNGIAMQVALRYVDEYRREDGRWKFSARTMSYMYYMPISELSELGHGEAAVRAYGDKRPADWPVTLYSDAGSSWLRDWV